MYVCVCVRVFVCICVVCVSNLYVPRAQRLRPDNSSVSQICRVACSLASMPLCSMDSVSLGWPRRLKSSSLRQNLLEPQTTGDACYTGVMLKKLGLKAAHKRTHIQTHTKLHGCANTKAWTDSETSLDCQAQQQWPSLLYGLPCLCGLLLVGTQHKASASMWPRNVFHTMHSSMLPLVLTPYIKWYPALTHMSSHCSLPPGEHTQHADTHALHTRRSWSLIAIMTTRLQQTHTQITMGCGCSRANRCAHVPPALMRCTMWYRNFLTLQLTCDNTPESQI